MRHYALSWMHGVCQTRGMTRLPEVVAHRGWATRYPENTLESLAAAIAAGVHHVEFDIQLSADLVPMLIHDETLDRTAGVAGCVMDIEYSELRQIGVGEVTRLGPEFETVLMPSLADARDLLLKYQDVTVFAEIKIESLERFGREPVLDACVAALDGLPGQVVITSFDPEVLEMARRRHGLSIAWVLDLWQADRLDNANRLGPEYLFCNYRKLPETPRLLPQGPWRWVLYEVTEVELAFELRERGVEFVESMRAGELIRELRLAGGAKDGT